MLLDLFSLMYEEEVEPQPIPEVYVPSSGGTMQWGEIERRMRERKEKSVLSAKVLASQIGVETFVLPGRVRGSARTRVEILSERESLSRFRALGVGRTVAPTLHALVSLRPVSPRGVAWTRMSNITLEIETRGGSAYGVGRGFAERLSGEMSLREVEVLVGEDLVLRDDEEVLLLMRV